MQFIIVFYFNVSVSELRGAIPYAVAQGLPLVPSYIISIIGNMLPVSLSFYLREKF